ncbi:hypothetical protein MGU_09408 [Metarhizium guizhouense ARSEF 977]|uniref:Uncharacterized protein n=1 Tax=Metarhizium guizhouense (strain ARSEF 977) TaxID=1276136 RepID=A0A0B4GUC2_METGA|nr:hypothetical protein MGU_09408 [Metarhizium guizhouense ARSEF 977]
MDSHDTIDDSDKTLTFSSPTDRTGRLAEFVDDADLESSEEYSQTSQTREEEYLEILEYIIAALGDLRLMLKDDSRARKSTLHVPNSTAAD